MDSDEGMEFISAGEEEAILAAKNKEQAGEAWKNAPGQPKQGMEPQQTLTGTTQESGGTHTVDMEGGFHQSRPPKEGEVVIDLTGEEELPEPQASWASRGLQRRSKPDDTLQLDATLQPELTLPSSGQETPTFPAAAAGSFQGKLKAFLAEGLDSWQRQVNFTGELSNQLKLTQDSKTQNVKKKIATIPDMGSKEGQEGPMGRISDAGACDPKVKVTTEEKLTKIKEIQGKKDTMTGKSQEPSGRRPEGPGEGPPRETERQEIQGEESSPAEKLSKQKKLTSVQERTVQSLKLTQKVVQLNKEQLPQELSLSETSGTDTEMERMLRHTEALETMVAVALKNIRENADGDPAYANVMQQFLQMDWQPTVAKGYSQFGKPEKERKGTKKQTDWSSEMIGGQERDRSPLKPERTQGLLDEEEDVEEQKGWEAGWSLRFSLQPPRHKKRTMAYDSVESGLEMETGEGRDETENLASLSETLSDEDLTSEWESCRDTLPSDQMGETLSDGQYGKKDPRLENWEEELRSSPDLIHQMILMPPYSENDMVKLWSYIAGHMALEPARATREFSKFGQPKIFGMLTKTRTHLLEVLTEHCSASDKNACRLRSLALAVTGKILCMRPMKKTKSRYPGWLREEEMIRMLQDVQRHWERRVTENKAPEPVVSLFLKDMDDPQSHMTAVEFVDWLATVVSHLKLRRKELREQARMEKRRLEERRPGTLTPTRKCSSRTPERRRLHDRSGQRAVEEDSTDGDGDGSRKAWRGGQGTSPAGGMSPQTGELGGKGRRDNGSPGLARSSEPTPTQIFEAEMEGKGKAKESKVKKALFEEGKGRQEGGKGEEEELVIPTSVKASWGSEVEEAEKAGQEREEGVEKKRRRREEPNKEIGQPGSEQTDTRPVPDFPPVKETAVTGVEKATLVPSEGRAAEKAGKRTGTESRGPEGGSKDKEEAGGRSERPPMQSDAANGRTKTPGGQKEPQGVGGDRKGSEEQSGDKGTLREGGQEQSVRPRVPRGQPPAPPTGGVSYARAVAGGTGTRSVSAQAPFPGLPRSELDILEDEEFLQRFYESIPEEQDPRQRYVIRFQYKGEDPNKVSREYVGREIVMKQLNVPREHIMALIIPLGSKEIDICLTSETAYQRFWEVLRVKKRLDPRWLEEYNIIPLFRGDTRVLTVSFRTTVIPPEDVAKWLKRRCRVLMEPEKKVDANGFWTGEYRAIVALYRDPVSGRIRHLPKYFFLGADRGITRYGGQPPACFRCGGFDHMRKFCPASLCSKCGTRGHNTADCKEEISCSLCAKRGHVYRFCPESELNIRYPEAFKREWERASRAREEEEGARQQDRETRNRDPDQAAGGPTGGTENVSKRKRREEARTGSGEERRKVEVQALCATANRFEVLQEEEEVTTEMEVAAGETGQAKSQRRERRKVRKHREPIGPFSVAGEKTMDELYAQQRKMRARRAALRSEREWWENRQKAKPTVEGEKSIQKLREEDKELGIDMEILDTVIEERVMREWEKEKQEEEKGEEETKKGKETEGETLSLPGLMEEEAETDVGLEKGNKVGKEKHGLVPVPPDPPNGDRELIDQLQSSMVDKPK